MKFAPSLTAIAPLPVMIASILAFLLILITPLLAIKLSCSSVLPAIEILPFTSRVPAFSILIGLEVTTPLAS